ncbi:AAA family ATPase [Sphingobium sp. TomTYG45]
MTATISKLRQLRNMGIFADYTHGASMPTLRRYNLIYGFNGSGKTTLSRIFQSLGAEQLSAHLPADGQLTIELSDGTLIKADSLKNGVSSRIVVFNQDFINDNLIWNASAAKPVFYIGTAQGNALKLLQLLEKKTGPRKQAYASANKECGAKEREFASFKTEMGKLVAEELSLGRRYNAANVETDYQGFNPANVKELSEDERKAKKALINRDAPAQDILFKRPEVFASANTIREALATCSFSLGGMMIEALTQHPTMTGWVKAGLDYHVAHSLSDCLHCGQKLTPERILALQASFDASYDNHVREIEESRTKIVGLMESLRGISDALPVGELPADLVDKFSAARTSLQDAGRRCFYMLRAVRLSLDEKGKSPNLSVSTTLPEAVSAIDAIDQIINQAVAAISEIVEAHNMRNSRFAAEQEEARKELKGHHLREGYSRYAELRASSEAAQKHRDIRLRLSELLDQRVADVRDKLRSHGPAVETINKLLKSFLGHGELALSTDGEGYRIQRRGQNAVGPLSEGEKTAVAFCYYLTKLEEDGRKKKDVIAVVDDPISSLDTKALNYAFSLLKRSLTDTSQLIVLTHNADFMNEAKKWLKSKAYPRDDSRQPDAALFFIATAVSPCGTIRSACIAELPTLLREYDSEYQYLFSLVFLFSEGRADEFAYLMPNAMRKVLEVFLAFKCPGSDGVEAKLERSIIKDCGIDPASLAALARLSNVESHGDSLDDLITLPSMTIEESKGAATCLFQLMQALDPQHFKGMTSISRKANSASAPLSAAAPKAPADSLSGANAASATVSSVPPAPSPSQPSA